MAPITTPTTMAITMAANPTAMEIRPPYNMRASRSCPRSSVPKGCAQEGPCNLALKSISLMGSFQTSGPSKTANTINANSTAPAKASLWWRNRFQVSAPSERGGKLPTNAAVPALPNCGNSAKRDSGVEPSIKQICYQITSNHQTGKYKRHSHHHRRVVGQYRGNQQ